MHNIHLYILYILKNMKTFLLNGSIFELISTIQDLSTNQLLKNESCIKNFIFINTKVVYSS